MDKKGFIYVMTNPSMPGLLKVGMTKKVPALRALDKDLNTTGVPTPFQIQYYAFFDDMISAEQQAHRKLQKYHHGKEFFKIDVATAIIEIESINIKFTKLYSTPDDDAKIVEIRTAKEAERRWREEAQRMKEEAKQVKKRSDELLKKQIEEDRKRYEKIESCIVEKKDNIEKKYEDLINEDFF